MILYNFLSRKKEIFKPLRGKRVGLYTCGPTVYNFVHVGNLRTYIFEDVLRRTLEYAGYRVKHVMNITDVEDKIIRDAGKADKPIRAFVDPFERAFFEDLAKLGITPAWKYPRATEHIPEMVRLIVRLLKKGIAYEMDGSVYFDISKFKRYGKLSRLKERELLMNASVPLAIRSVSSGTAVPKKIQHFRHRGRIDFDEYAKQDVQDFVLWKGKKLGEPSWPAPFGEGRPGWHIECSAMAMKYLGSTFDIHAGGVDLLFPHHENEIVQSEGATGKPFVKFFIEGEHLLVDGQKMSKSLGNIFTLRDLEARGVNPLAFRYLVLTSHYRSKLNFTWASLAAAENSLKKLYEIAGELKMKNEKQKTTTKNEKILTNFTTQFKKVIFNDLNMPAAMSVVWKLISAYHKSPGKFDAKHVLAILYDFDRVFGLRLKDIRKVTIPADIIAMTQEREEYRKKKNWAKADALRKQIASKGYVVEDTPEGQKVKTR